MTAVIKAKHSENVGRTPNPEQMKNEKEIMMMMHEHKFGSEQFEQTNMPADTTTSTIYRDFLCKDILQVKSEIKIADGHRRGPRGGVTEPFPSKLYALLEDSHSKGMSHIISWQVHGRSFTIHDLDMFARELLPIYFRQKMSSFKRQMNLYGFRRGLAGTDYGSYYHELFLRGRPDLASIMRRTGVGGSEGWRLYQGEEDPNFYAYPFCPDLSSCGRNVVSDTSDASDQCFSDSSDDRAAGQQQDLRVQLKSIEPLSTESLNVPCSIILRKRFDFLGPKVTCQTISLATEINTAFSFDDDFASDISEAMGETEDFDLYAIESLLACELLSFNKNFL